MYSFFAFIFINLLLLYDKKIIFMVHITKKYWVVFSLHINLIFLSYNYKTIYRFLIYVFVLINYFFIYNFLNLLVVKLFTLIYIFRYKFLYTSFLVYLNFF